MPDSPLPILPLSDADPTPPAGTAPPMRPIPYAPDGRRDVLWLLRLLVALAWGLICGLVAAGVAYLVVPREYTATGVIEVRPPPTPGHVRRDEPSYRELSDYAAGQAALVRSEHVRDLALADRAWTALGRGLTPQVQEQFAKSLRVTSDGPIVSISFRDANVNAPKVAVGAISEAYVQICKEAQYDAEQRYMRVLEDQRARVGLDLEAIRRQIARLVELYGTDTLDPLYLLKLREKSRAEGLLEDFQLQQAGASTQPAAQAQAAAEQEKRLAQRVKRVMVELQVVGSANVQLKALRKDEEAKRRLADDLQTRLAEWQMTMQTYRGPVTFAAGPAESNAPYRTTVIASAGGGACGVAFVVALVISFFRGRRARLLRGRA